MTVVVSLVVVGIFVEIISGIVEISVTVVASLVVVGEVLEVGC